MKNWINRLFGDNYNTSYEESYDLEFFKENTLESRKQTYWVKNDIIDVKIVKISEDAIIPTYSQIGDAGLDLTATSMIVTDGYIQYGTSLTIEIPEGYFGLLLPRSSITKAPPGVSLKNNCGIIDSNYRGELLLRFELPYNISYGVSNDFIVPKIGDRVGQLIILPYPKINFIVSEHISETNRGSGGFGSTGN
jgi:dUTP pyrophosphatase